MKTVGVEEADLDAWIQDAQQERVLITRQGKPVALIIGVEGIDQEQLELGSSNTFWTLIAERRGQKTISRAELDQRLTASGR